MRVLYMFAILLKLTALQCCLRDWNYSVYGDVHKNVTMVKEKPHNIQNINYSTENSQERFNEEIEARRLYLMLFVCKKLSGAIMLILNGLLLFSMFMLVVGIFFQNYYSFRW